MSETAILAIANMAVQYGIPALTSALTNLGKETITDEDIDALSTLIKRPEDYK